MPTKITPTDIPIKIPETKSCTSVPPVVLETAPHAIPKTTRIRL